MKLHIRIFFGYIILMAVIGSMTAILVHERGRMREIELESVEIRKIRQGISTAHLYITGLAILGEGVINWEKTDYLHYRNQRLQTDSLLQSLKSYSGNFVHPAQLNTLRILLVDKIEQPFVSLERFMPLDNLHQDVHQLDLERYACLLAFRHNPRYTIHFNDVVGSQVLDVRERDARPTTEQEQVSCQCKVGIVQLDCTQRLNFVLREKATLLVVGVKVVHRKRVSRYLSVIVCCGNDVFQRYGIYAHG